MIRLYMDENVEGQIVRGLRARGIDVLTAEEDGYKQIPDPEVLDRATALARVTFTRDDDFLRDDTRRLRRSETFGGVIYAHKQHVRLGLCIADLEVLAAAGHSEDFESRVSFLPL